MIKGSIQEEITILNIYAANIGGAQYLSQLQTPPLLKENDSLTMPTDFCCHFQLN